MKLRLALAMMTIGGGLLAVNPSAYAIGCISGGVAGAVAGHMVHHGVLGAIGGCVAGHEYHKHERERRLMEQRNNDGGYAQHDSSGTYRNSY